MSGSARCRRQSASAASKAAGVISSALGDAAAQRLHSRRQVVVPGVAGAHADERGAVLDVGEPGAAQLAEELVRHRLGAGREAADARRRAARPMPGCGG